MTESYIGQPVDSVLPPDPDSDADELVRVENLVKYFPVRGSGLISRTVAHVQAVDGVSLRIRRGQTLGLVGETGCGKSTLARCIAGLIPITSGKVFFEGHDITNLSRRAMQPYRREIQMIFQDPYGSLNPRRRVGSIIGAPFSVHNTATGNQRKKAYTLKEIDTLVAYIVPEDLWYVLPVRLFRKIICLKLFPNPRRRVSKYNVYREEWQLLGKKP